MKNKLLISLLVAGLGFSACHKKTLDLLPYTALAPASAFETPQKVLLSVYGVYDAAQSGFYAGGAVRGYPFGAAYIAQGDMRGEDMLNQALFYQITYEATYNSASPNNGFQFQTLYSLINKANLTIDGIRNAATSGVISAAQANQYEGELRFLRALAHHELVINFARPYADNNGGQTGIIYRDIAVTAATADQAAALKRTDFTVADNYQKILADLDYAETNMAATPELKTYRASKAAAIALKMRVKMHMGDWAGVKTEGEKLVPASAPYVSPIGGWTLNASPNGAFTGPTSNENIFSIKNDATDNGSVNGAMSQMYGDPALGARGLVAISPIIWSNPNWLCSDLRRTQLYRTAGTPVNTVYTTKYFDYATYGDPAPQIRYAEVLLTLAEAEARLATGVSERALNLLNAVRNRAVTTPADQFTLANVTAKDELVNAILLERRIEFLAEGKRWGDIHRLALDPVFAPVPGGGIPAKVGTGGSSASMYNCAGATINRAVPAIPYSDHRFIWPIPIEEVQQNPNYTQNPNY